MGQALVEDRIETYLEARDRGVQWLLKQFNPDGSLGPVQEGVHYFRAPWTLAICGQTSHAMRLLGWIRGNMLTPEGDFAGRYPRGEVFDPYYIYPNACLVMGAQILRQYDISTRAMRFLIGRQDPRSGGFLRHRAAPVNAEAEVMSTCQAGFACLITGHLDAAKKVAYFLQRLWELQPELPERLYVVYDTAKGELVTQFPPEESFGYVVISQAERQAYFMPGIAAAFLARLYMAEPRAEYLELARRYEEFGMGCTGRMFDVPQFCKVGWGSALLYQLTGEKHYLEFTLRCGDWYCAHQFPEGFWHNRDDWQPERLENRINVTAEFALHLDTIIGALSSRWGES